MVRWQLRKQPRPGTTCKSYPRSQRRRWRMRLLPAAHRSGSSSIRRNDGRLATAWPSGRKARDARQSSSLLMCSAHKSGKRSSGFGASTRANAAAAMRRRAICPANPILRTPNLTWEFIKRLRDTVRTKLVLKGILAPEDARLAAANGIDAIIVSNHGGRAEDGSGSTIEALPEIIDAVNGRVPVLIDSGFRRGTDVVKALAMGARAVCIGRPYLWGLGAFGQPGVERVLEILRAETRAAMQQVGAPSIKDLVPAMVRRA